MKPLEVSFDYFLPYQKLWINDPEQISIRDKSRRTGGTETVAFEALLWGLETKMKSRDVWFTSADKKAAEEFIIAVKFWSRVFNAVAETVNEQIINPDDEDKFFLKYEIKIPLANGGLLRVHAMSSSVNSFHGKQGFMIVDEMARHKDQVGLWEGAFPATLWGYPLRIISTQNGKGLFYQLCEECKKGKHPEWGYHHVDIYEAVEDGLLDKILQSQEKLAEDEHATEDQKKEWFETIRKNCLTERVWNQQFLCKAEDENDALIPYELIYACRADDVLLKQDKIKIRWNGLGIKDAPEHRNSKWVKDVIKNFAEWFYEYRTPNDLYMGLDIGRHKDLTVFWITEKISRIHFTRLVIELHQMPYWVQEQILAVLLKHNSMRRCLIDATGKGENLAENAKLRYKSIVEPVIFNNRNKEAMAERTKAAFEDRTIVIPDDSLIVADIHSIKRETTEAGNVRLAVTKELDENGNEIGHADRFWALALCLAGDEVSNATPKTKSGRKRVHNKLTEGYYLTLYNAYLNSLIISLCAAFIAGGYTNVPLNVFVKILSRLKAFCDMPRNAAVRRLTERRLL